MRRHARLALLAGATFLTLFTQRAAAQATDTVTYRVSFPNAVHHEAEITATFSALPPGGTLELRMSRASPGRYALHEFAKNVYSVRVTDGAGRELATTRPDPYGWNVSGHDGTVRVTYTLFADRADGTYSGVSREHAHLSMPATFMYARGLRGRPIRVTFAVPEGSMWSVATQLVPSDDAFTFTAPDLDYFMDSPAEVARLRIRTWTITSGGRRATLRIAAHDPSSDEELDRFVQMAQVVAAEEAAVFGEYAPYDHGVYTFLACYGPWADGDGMEHRNSTSLTSARSIEESALGNLGTLSHEFFHSWNMERIRSAELEPFDFDGVNMSDELWFGEGFTSYFDDLFLARAGLTEPRRYVAGLAGGLNAVINGPGRLYGSPVEMSRWSPFWDAATSIDPTNQQNTFISYYTWGSVIGLGLDLTLRTRFGLTLDGFMRAMWARYGRPEVHYRLDDIRETLADYTGDAAFADDFFTRYVTGREVPDYAGLLATVGVVMRRARPGAATVGRSALRAGRDGVVAAVVLVGTPLYSAGIDAGDVILSLDGVTVASAEQIGEIAARHRPGDVVPVTFESQGRLIGSALIFAEDPTLEVLAYEEAGMTLTDAMGAARADWLGSKAGS